MPLRAFLLFGRFIVGIIQLAVDLGFQCPCGHFCFSDTPSGRPRQGWQTGFNALAGIFAFRTIWVQPRFRWVCTWFVSMPLRAFLLFGPNTTASAVARAIRSFNALAGIFAFRTESIMAKKESYTLKFQCPCGHFCFSDNAGQLYLFIFDDGKPFQCPCGHFCFSDLSYSQYLWR